MNKVNRLSKLGGYAAFTIACILLSGQTFADTIKAGPIWNQADAQVKCPRVAKQHNVEWTGQWWTTIQGKMSVCQTRPKPAVTRTVKAGPIWNQADANVKCPRIAKQYHSVWTGQWWTTIQGKMSVCQIKSTPKYVKPAAPKPKPHAKRATVYQHCNYGGYAVHLAPGRYNMQQLQARGIRNDDLSSIKMPSGITVTAYQHHNYGGQSWSIRGNNSCFVNNGYNDVISSIVVSSAHHAQSCYNAAQGKVAWNRNGSKQWSPSNLRNLCKGTTHPQRTINCFKNAIASHGQWQRGIQSCAGKY